MTVNVKSFSKAKGSSSGDSGGKGGVINLKVADVAKDWQKHILSGVTPLMALRMSKVIW